MSSRIQGLRRVALGAVLLAIIGWAVWFGISRTPRARKQLTPEQFITNALATLIQSEAEEAGKYWGPELISEPYRKDIDALWDRINRSTNKLETLGSASVGELRMPILSPPIAMPWAISMTTPTGGDRPFTSVAWRAWLHERISEGWELAQCEFRANGFLPGQNPAITYYVSGHLINRRTEERVIVEGTVNLFWGGEPAHPQLQKVDASNVQLRRRTGPPPFQQILDEEVAPPEGSYFIDPLIVWDLAGDRRSEIILAARNMVFRWRTNTWETSALCEESQGIILNAVLGDFTGDGKADFLCAKFDGLYLYEGKQSGKYSGAPRQVWKAQPHLKYAQAIAIGDIDGDGDLDLFLGQYKVPYFEGQMATPYFDANDGFPSYLLINDGQGNFTDATVKSGLGAKRARRVYSASLIDLDRDNDLDLVVVSDFAGLDAFENDGTGHFHDAGDKWFSERHALGMGHTFADFDGNGRIDLLMIGMNSPVASRLDSLGLNRPYDRPDQDMRAKVTFGNRLYFGQEDGAFRETTMGTTVARTGWSWGAAACDIDGDGFPDLYITNGHESRESVHEYEPEFWLHDIYVGNSQENALALKYFRDKFSKTRGKGDSYGGYEKNRLFLNLQGTNFLECAFLFGVALETDCRNVLWEDVTGDGRPDLILTTFEAYPKVRQTLKVFQNELAPTNLPPGRPADDVRQIGKLIQTRRGAIPLITTDSYRSQRQPRLPAQ